MFRAKINLYATIALFSFRNHWGDWRYTLLRLLSFIFFTLVIGEFWRAVIALGGRSFDFDGNDIIWYSGVGQMIMFASTRIFIRIEDDVLSGNIAYSLLRPVGYLELRLTEGVGNLCANLCLFAPIGFAVCYFYTGAMPKGSLAFTSAFILCSSLLHMLFQVLAGFCGVWLHEVQLIYRIYQRAMALAGGLEVPISVYPAAMQYFSWATPLGLLLSRPCAAIYITDRTELIKSAILLFGWTAILFVATLRSYARVHKFICLNGG